jgi:hypothetical protein
LFKPSLKFVPQADAVPKSEADVMKLTSMLDAAGFKDSVVVSTTSNTGSVSKGSTFKRPKAWDAVMAEDNVDLSTVPTAAQYTHDIAGLQKVASHKAKYTEYLRKQRGAREDAVVKAQEVRAVGCDRMDGK